MVHALLGLIGIAICTLVAYVAVTYWKSVYYVSIKNYLMMFYYGVIGLCGVVCICA